MRQWTRTYENRSVGHITAPSAGSYLIVVYPPDAPDIGNLSVEYAPSLDDAVRVANALAKEDSSVGDWKPNIETLRLFVDGLQTARGDLMFMQALKGDPDSDHLLAVQFPGVVLLGTVIREPSRPSWRVVYVRNTGIGCFGVVERVEREQ